MSGRKPRSVANPLESAITTPSERILKECHSVYVDSENGKITRISVTAKVMRWTEQCGCDVPERRQAEVYNVTVKVKCCWFLVCAGGGRLQQLSVSVTHMSLKGLRICVLTHGR